MTVINERSWQTAHIVKIDVLSPRIRRFVLRPEHWQPALAGQHLDVRLTADDGYQAQRSYSLLTAAAGSGDMAGTYELAIELLDDGEVSPYFHEVAAVGDTLEVRGPFGGHFVWQASDPAPVLLIGGGSGAVPLLAMAQERKLRQSTAAMAFLYAARQQVDVIQYANLQAWAAAGDGFQLRLALSREMPLHPEDFSGRIDSNKLQKMLDLLGTTPVTTYICGSNGFVETASQALLTLGVDATTIRTERFGGS